MADSIGKLQSLVIKQEKQILKLKDRVAELTDERDILKLRLNQLEKN